MTFARLSKEERGAVFVEQLIAYLPIIFFFLATWQLLELCAAQLIVQRAASAAVRAAIVVYPDDDAFYQDAAPGEDPKTGDVKLAAALILAANPHLSEPVVQLDGADKGTRAMVPVTATVTSRFSCFAGWASLVCGLGGSRPLTAKSSHVFQGAEYRYDP
jgi:hypothetical protein